MSAVNCDRRIAAKLIKKDRLLESSEICYDASVETVALSGKQKTLRQRWRR